MSSSINLFDPAFREDPYPFYAESRARSPVAQVDPIGAWLVTGYDAVVEVLKSPSVYSSAAMHVALSQIETDEDGRFEIVLAHRDPGHRNWIDTGGHHAGYLLARSLLLMVREGATHIGVAFDHVVESFRNDLFDGYKSGEGLEPELAAQFDDAERAAAALGIAVWPMDRFEADDGLAPQAVTLAEAFSAAGYATDAVQTNGWLHQSFGFHQGFDRYLFPQGGRGPQFEKPSVWPHADRVVAGRCACLSPLS